MNDQTDIPDEEALLRALLEEVGDDSTSETTHQLSSNDFTDSHSQETFSDTLFSDHEQTQPLMTEETIEENLELEDPLLEEPVSEDTFNVEGLNALSSPKPVISEENIASTEHSDASLDQLFKPTKDMDSIIEPNNVAPSAQTGTPFGNTPESTPSTQAAVAPPNLDPNKILNLLKTVPTNIHCEIGQLDLTAEALADLQIGSIINLHKSLQEPVTLTKHGKALAEAEIVDLNGNIGIRITNIYSHIER